MGFTGYGLGIMAVVVAVIFGRRLTSRGLSTPLPSNPWGLPTEEYRALMDRVLALKETNPAEAERVLKEAMGPAIQRHADARANLWARAPSDPQGARQLHDALQEGLETDRYALSEMRNSAPAVLDEIRASISQAERDLATVTPWLPEGH